MGEMVETGEVGDVMAMTMAVEEGAVMITTATTMKGRENERESERGDGKSGKRLLRSRLQRTWRNTQKAFLMEQ